MAKYYVRVDTNGTFWCKDEHMQILHRDNRPAVEWVNGDKYWYKDGNMHRDNGPAVELGCGYKAWWINGKLHREDGPAIELENGDVQYWLNGNKMSKKKWEQAFIPKELTIAQIEQLLGHPIKIVK